MSPDNTRTKRSKRDLFDQSGLTEDDRRQVRSSLRDVKAELNAGKLTPFEARDKNNSYANKVCFTREAALDAENVEAIADEWGKEMEKHVQVQRFDGTKLVQTLANKCSVGPGGSFGWTMFGKECGVCFNTMPGGIVFLAGAMDQAVSLKVRKRAAPRQKPEDEKELKEAQPERVETKEKNTADKLSAMDKLFRRMRKKVKATVTAIAEEDPSVQEPTIDAVSFLHNPKSFTQTVENIFTYGFLVKKGEGGTRIDEDGNWLLTAHEGEETSAMKATQSVCSFTMADWRRMNERHQEQCIVGHRAGMKNDMEE